MDTMGPWSRALGQARSTMEYGHYGSLGALGQDRPTMNTIIGPLGQPRPNMDTMGPLEPWERLCPLWTMQYLSIGTGYAHYIGSIWAGWSHYGHCTMGTLRQARATIMDTMAL